MRIASIDRVDYPRGIEQLPLEIRQSCSLWRSAVRIVLSLFAIAVLLAPVVLIATDALQKPNGLARMAERPLSTVLVLAGLAIASTLMIFPLRWGLSAFARRCILQLSANGISFEDKGLMGTRTGFVPLSQYYGIVHHIRATLSGTRHELILLHANREDNVLLSFGTDGPELGEDHFGRLLGMPQLPAGALYARRGDPQPDPGGDIEITSAAA